MANNASSAPQPTESQHKKVLIKRQGTTGGKLPYLSWRNSKLWRYISQSLFIAINLYIGLTFYLWVKYYESGANAVYVARPSGIEGWLPLAGLMNLKFILVSHQLPPIYVGAVLLLVAFLLISFIFKRAFCSWLCPVGTLSEIVWHWGQSLFKFRLTPPKWLDIPLRTLKYLMLGVIFYFLIPMSVTEIAYFLTSPYGIIIDVKMLDFFRHIGQTTLIVVTTLTLASLFIQNAWCRYLCPYGALMAIAALFSPFKIRRDANACIDCQRCAKVCPARIPVDKLLHVNSTECITCMTCIEVCPAEDALQLALRPKAQQADNGDRQGIKARWQGRKISGLAVIITIYCLLFALIGYANYQGVWDSPVPEKYYQQFIPKMREINHPMV